jgi:hypothetical protein
VPVPGSNAISLLALGRITGTRTFFRSQEGTIMAIDYNEIHEKFTTETKAHSKRICSLAVGPPFEPLNSPEKLRAAANKLPRFTTAPRGPLVMALDCEEITAEERAQRQRDRTFSLAVGPPFEKLDTPEKMREAVNKLRKGQGLPPLPEPPPA